MKAAPHASPLERSRLGRPRVQRPEPHDLDASLAAIGDGRRRDIIRALLHKPRRAGELAECVDMTPQALSRHLRILRKAGLVVEQGFDKDARVRIYSVRLIALEPVQEWLWYVDGQGMIGKI